MIETHAERWLADHVIIELDTIGRHLFSQLQSNLHYGKPKYRPKAVGMRPREGKVERMLGQVAKIESGLVRIPRSAEWLEAFLNEVSAFPNGRHDDQVDSLSQFLEYTGTTMGIMLLTTNPESGRQRGRGYYRRLRRR